MATIKKPAPVQPEWMRYSWRLIPIIALAVYIPSYFAGWTLDDVLIVEENTYLRSLSMLPDIWTSHYWAGKIDATDTGLYRPLTLTTYNLQYVIHGNIPALFHMVNILLHALVCLVLMKMILLLFGDFRLAVVAGLLYAIHPVHTEAVCGIVGRAEILAALFILTASISYHRWRMTGDTRWLLGLFVSAFAAMTSKEHGFMLPILLILQEAYYFFSSKSFNWADPRKWLALGSVILVAALMWTVRSAVTGPPAAHEQWKGVAAAERMATSVRTTTEYMVLHIWPLQLSADYWTDNVPVIGFGHPEVSLFIVVTLLLLGSIIYYRRKLPVAAWGLFFFYLAILPVSNFLFAAGFLKAERILYIPSIGLIIAISVWLLKIYDLQKRKVAGMIFFSVLLLFFAGRTWTRAGDWQNNFTLAKATLKTSPNSPRFNNMMGLELRRQKKNEEALIYFEKAVRSNPNHVPALVNLGTEYRHFERLPEAAATLERALALDPNTLATYVNLMSVYRSMKDYAKNVSIADKALERFPGSAAIIWNAANAYHLQGNMEKANELRARAREIDPSIGKG